MPTGQEVTHSLRGGSVHFRCQLLGNQLGHEKELKSLAFNIGESELFFLTRFGPLESGLWKL